MNTPKNFNEKKVELLQLLSIGMPVAIIMAYFKISNSTCIKYIKKLRESKDWNEENVSFLKSIPNVITAFLLTRKYRPDMGIIEPQRLQIAIEEVLEFKRILEILKISINSIYKMTLSEFSSEVPNEYRKLVKAILREDDKIHNLRDDEEKSILLDYLSSGKDFQVGETIDKWFYPLINFITSEYIRDLRNSVKPVFNVDIIERVEFILSELTPKEAEILRKYFGIGFGKIDFNLMAEELDLTWTRVYQIYKKAIRRCQMRVDFLFQSNPLPTRSSPPTTPVTFTPIEQLDLSVRALNILKAAEIGSLEELAGFKKTDLLKFRNMGKKSIDEFEKILTQHNLKFL